MNKEHEELEERQQALLEQLGDRLSAALRGEQFWKQTLKKVVLLHTSISINTLFMSDL
jgi:hypothetical protein